MGVDPRACNSLTEPGNNLVRPRAAAAVRDLRWHLLGAANAARIPWYILYQGLEATSFNESTERRSDRRMVFT